MDYLECTFILEPRLPWADILVAELADLGFESFVETTKGIQAYIPKTTDFSLEEIVKQTSLHQSNEVIVSTSIKEIPHQNWNALWEADFEPVLVKDELAIIAPFHDSNSFSTKYKIIIQPQMSFGTGHHQTTHLMSEFVLEMNSVAKKVLDMGTGTGVLAILAEMKGANEILAVDIEPWSVANTIENANRNQAKHIVGRLGDIDLVIEKDFGLILANINKNVLKAHLPFYSTMLSKNGELCLSGFFSSDVAELTEIAHSLGLELVEQKEKETWAALRFKK